MSEDQKSLSPTTKVDVMFGNGAYQTLEVIGGSDLSAVHNIIKEGRFFKALDPDGEFVLVNPRHIVWVERYSPSHHTPQTSGVVGNMHAANRIVL